MIRLVRLAVLTAAAGLLLAGEARAQLAVFPTADAGRWARAEAGRPVADDPASRDGLSAAWFFTFTTPIPGGVVMVVEVPVAHLSPEGQGGPTTAMGNPYVGARLQFDARVLSEFEVGIRLPVAREASAALGYGIWADLADRPEAFHPRAMPLTLRAIRTFEVQPGTAVDLGAGTVWWLMAGPEHTEQNIFVTYSGLVRTELGPVRLSGGASGRYSALGTAIEPLVGATHQVSGSIDTEVFGLQPGAYITVPLTQPAAGRVSATLGLRLLVPIGS